MNISYLHGFLGGALIGLAAVLLYWFNGRTMGVSGILSRLLDKPGHETTWRLAFIVGLITGGLIASLRSPVVIDIQTHGWLLIVSGLLVGFGTIKGNGCTSGHGICGMARLSKRSIVATLVFMATAMLTVWLKKLGGF